MTIGFLRSESAFSGATEPVEAVRITMPAQMAFEFLPFTLGKERGIYRSQGIALELPVLRPQLSVAAVISGEADYISTLISPARAAVEGLPFKILMVLVDRPLFHLVAQPEVESVRDLKGKTIASGQLKSGSQLSVASFLRSGGLNPDQDVRWTYLPEADQALAALVSRAVGAAMLAPPVHVHARRLGFRDLGHVGKTFSAPIHGLATLEKKLREKPDQVRRVILATLKSVAHVREHPEEVIEEVKKTWRVDHETARESYRLMLSAMTPDGTMAEDSFRKGLLEVLAGEGLGEERSRAAIRNLLDYEPLRQALREIDSKNRK
jgi:NitT/TauT family transport system substrate-binding protein